MEFCEYCGNLLNNDGRCPWAKKADAEKVKASEGGT